ncbi:MAG: hypothetical protein JSU01_12950 [Bacteroidetes bacterium]|nr:hypothetical protein [Bacteroidota bacterium]
MRKTIVFILLFFAQAFAYAQPFQSKRITIPLNQEKGVPFYVDPELSDIGIQGFEIDDKGKLYFLGGKNNLRLAVFSENNCIFSKNYGKATFATLYYRDNKLYSFDRFNKELIVVNAQDGTIIHKLKCVTSKRIDDYFFSDQGIVLSAEASEPPTFDLFDFNGKFIKSVANEYAVLATVFPKAGGEFLGKWDNNFVFWDLVDDDKTHDQMQKFWVIDKTGKTIATRLTPNKLSTFGAIYVENPVEHRKVRNGNLYILGRSLKSKSALITVVPLKTFFAQ